MKTKEELEEEIKRLKDYLREIVNYCDHTGPFGELCECYTHMCILAETALRIVK